MKKFLFLLWLSLGSLYGSSQTVQQIRNDFEMRRVELSALSKSDSLQTLPVDDECRTALQFLYAYMPWPDVADRSVNYYVEQTRIALQARREMPWGKQVPEQEWLHFVLPVRVNNESLDKFRTTYYNELKERVKGLSMSDAVLEINHWCHEHVTYQPSDARTSSPMATLQTATGRCGEESTLTVAALRTVGIPARQVYTPRWAHTDDNHAWVEAWADGAWHFLGACEPEAVLDLGWFNQPASRGMLMHTKVFGRYRGEEDIMAANPCFTEINVTPHYARTARTTITVVDAQGKPCPGAVVEFKVYNYAELYTVQRTRANAQGQASILTGLGDLVAWASQADAYGFEKFRAGSEGIVVKLTRRGGEAFTEELNITPPEGSASLPQVSEAAAARNARRLAEEDALRTAYVHSFPDSVSTLRWCERQKLPFEEIRPLVVKSCGNWRNLYALLSEQPDRSTLQLLRTLTDKDLRDFSLPVLRSHLRHLHTELSQPLPEDEQQFLYRYLYSPRIAGEQLSTWLADLEKLPAEVEHAVQEGPEALAAWITSHIVDNTERNPLGYPLSPARALEGRRADLPNRKLLFVALCRSHGIPARIDEVTGQAQYVVLDEKKGVPSEHTAKWQTASLEPSVAGKSAKEPAAARLTLDYTPRQYMENPAYYHHFTLSRLQNGSPVLQNYPETDTWKSTFRRKATVHPGNYLLTTGTRLADGSVLARLSVFPLAAGTDRTEPLVMRTDETAVQVIGTFNSENRFFDPSVGGLRSLLSATGRGYFVVGLLRPNHEPSNHVLHDLEKQRAALEAWGRPIVLLFSSEEAYARFQKNRAEFTNLPSTVSFGVDADGSVRRDMEQSGLMKSGDYPVLLIADTFNRVVSCTQGYTIGIGSRLTSTIGKLTR